MKLRQWTLLCTYLIITSCGANETQEKDDEPTNLDSTKIENSEDEIVQESGSIEEFDEYELVLHEQIVDFIEDVNSNDLKKVAEHISFPLRRNGSLPYIETKKDFINYDFDLFDEDIKKKLNEYLSNPDIIDRTGANGMYGILNGMLWFWEDGKMTALAYSSVKEEKQDKIVRAKIEKLLPASISDYDQNHFLGFNSKFTIRIDYMNDEKGYRYASWSKGVSVQDEPDIILENGEYIHQGSGGSYWIDFKNKEYTYRLDNVNICAADDCGIYLVILKEDKEISREKLECVMDELEFIQNSN